MSDGRAWEECRFGIDDLPFSRPSLAILADNEVENCLGENGGNPASAGGLNASRWDGGSLD